MILAPGLGLRRETRHAALGEASTDARDRLHRELEAMGDLHTGDPLRAPQNDVRSSHHTCLFSRTCHESLQLSLLLGSQKDHASSSHTTSDETRSD